MITEINERVSFDIPNFNGSYSYGDLLVLVLHRGLTTSYLIGSLLQNNFLFILYNISPFLRDLSALSVNSLFELVSSYTHPKLILRNKDGFFQIKLIMSSILNILSYNFETNALLVLELLNRKANFEKLFELHFNDIKENMVKVSGTWKATDDWFNENKLQLPIRTILAIISTVLLKREQAYLI